MAEDGTALRVELIELEFSLSASRERVWEAMVYEIDQWWPAAFHVLDPESQVVLEPEAGGRLFERLHNSGLLWYIVLAIDPPSMLTLTGNLTPAFGGPASSLLHLEFEVAGEGTRLKMSDTLMGAVSDESLRRIRGGWKMLFEQGLKAYVEGNR